MNKTPGQLRVIVRAPALLKMPFRGMKAFLSEKLRYLIKVSNVSKYNFFPLFAEKKHQKEEGQTFFRKNNFSGTL